MSRAASTFACLAGTVAAGAIGLLFSLGALGQIQFRDLQRPDAAAEEFSTVYLPTDRSMTRAMSRVRERLAGGEYQQSLTFLQEVFSREEDSFLERSEDGSQQLGLKSTARQLIGALPEEGHDLYELLYGAAARRELEAALQSRQPSRLAAVVRKFFHTWAGYEAALILAQMEADQGHYLAAAGLYRELIETPRAAARFEPQLSMRAAMTYVAASRSDLALTTLRSIRKRFPQAPLQLAGEPTPAPKSEEELVAWLTKSMGVEPTSQTSSASWLTVRGNPARSIENSGGAPHLRPRWEARVINDPAVEAHLSERQQEFSQRGVAAIPAARPIAVDDVVIMRTPRNVVAVDWRTGKRIWETRTDEELESPQRRSRFASGVEEDSFPEQDNSLEQRMWDDSLVTSLSSDGERVFVLRGKAPAARDDVVAFQVMQGMVRNAREAPATTNQLAAYDLATQGKLVWELDGVRMTGPLAGAYFLGAPLAIDDTLYVMAEIRSAIYLLALEPATGKVQWQQQLVGLERGIALDPLRGQVAAAPSYNEGVLICPTSAGAVLAIDCTKRELLWAYRYATQPRSPHEARNFFQPPVQSPTVRSNDRWLDSSAIISDGFVLVTPPESAELHCLELQTGKVVWKMPKDELLFIGCADGGKALLVGSKSLHAVRLADGMPAWERPRAALPTGALPAGHGYLSDGKYYLPLTNNEIAAIAVADGAIDRIAANQHSASLGNLICYRGSIISQSPLVLDKFEQLEVLQQRVQAALSKDSNNAAALRDLGELQHAEGKTAEAVQSLKSAYELAPNDPLSREMLAEHLLDALAVDFAAFQGELPLVTQLIQGRDERIELMRLEAQGLDQLGQRLAAWDAYVRLGDFTAEVPEYLAINNHHTVRSDRWLCGRLGELWSNATAEERNELASRLEKRRERLHNSTTAAELRHYLACFDGLPGANHVRRQLAQLLISRDREREAELELLQLAVNHGEQNRAYAANALAKLSRTTSPESPWPDGKVVAQYIDDGVRDRRPNGQPQSERHAGLRSLHIEQEFLPGIATTEWFTTVDGSEIVARSELGDDLCRVVVGASNPSRRYRETNYHQAARLGHVLVVSVGSHIVAMDSHASMAGSENQLLWQTDRPGSRRGALVSRRYATWNTQNRVGRRTVYHAWSGRKRPTHALGGTISMLGPATPRGIVIHEDNELKCLDPLSGEAIWTRTDLPAGCELFGDDEFAFAADVGERKAHVIRIVDGQLVGERKLPRYEWLLTAGRCLAQLGIRTSGGQRTRLPRITDVWSQETLFEEELPIASRISVVEPDLLAVYEPSGRFRVIDVRTGKQLAEQTLESTPDLHSMETFRSGDMLYLFINRQAQLQQFHKPVGQQENPLISGFVYAFEIGTGEPVWHGPVTVRNRGLIVTQPQGIPFLVFADHKTTREAPRGNRTQLRLLCIDKRTGRTVYRNDNLPDSSGLRFRIRGERDGQPSVTVETNRGRIELAMTNEPRPPQPPANDDLEMARQSAQRGLLGLTERMLRGELKTPDREDPIPPDAPQPVLDDD